MTEWEVRRIIVEPDPDRMTVKGIEACWVATDGGNDPMDLFHTFRRAYPECTISAAGPWKWHISLFYPVPVDQPSELSTRLLAAIQPGNSYADRGQIRHLQALPLIRVTSLEPTNVVLSSTPFKIPVDRLPPSMAAILNLNAAQDVLTVRFDTDDWHLRNRQLRVIANYLVLRFDPNHRQTREIIGEPLP